MKKTMLVAIVLAALAMNARATDWMTDFDKGLEKAKADGKYMLVDFSGSDWCGWCMKLEKEVFSQDSFNKYSGEKLVCVLLDFPQKKKLPKEESDKNSAIAAKYKVEGFPTVLIFSPEGDLAGTTGYQPGGPDAYVTSIKKIIAEHQAKVGVKQAAVPEVAPVVTPAAAGTFAPVATDPK